MVVQVKEGRPWTDIRIPQTLSHCLYLLLPCHCRIVYRSRRLRRMERLGVNTCIYISLQDATGNPTQVYGIRIEKSECKVQLRNIHTHSKEQDTEEERHAGG